MKYEGIGNDGQSSWTIINGDCLEEMEKMPSESVDYVFTSPPYNDSAKTERDIETRRHAKYKDIEYREDWFEWQTKCIDEMLRVAKKMVLYNVQAILSNKADVYKLIGHYADKIHMILIWYKPNAQPQGYDHRIGNNYEMILILKANQFDGLWCNSKNYNTVIVQNINSDRRYNGLHHAIMSQNFADEIITEFTQRGETVLDPFCGMATTGIACINNHRNFVGIEIDKEYCEAGKDRLVEDTAQIRMEIVR